MRERKITGSVYKKGNKYYYRFKYHGESICHVGTEDKAETEALMHDAIAECKNQNKVFRPVKGTLIQLINEWYERECKKSIRHGTKQDYQRCINNRIAASDIGKMKIAQISPSDIQEYFNKQNNKYSISTLKADRAVLNGTFRYAKVNGMIKSNPMHDVDFQKRTSKQVTFLDIVNDDDAIDNKILSEEDISKILEIFKNTKYYLPIMIGYCTGMREGEVCALSKDCIYLDKKQIKVNKSMYYDLDTHRWELGPTKSGKSRTIDIGDTLVKLIHDEMKNQLIERSIYNDIYNEYYYAVDTVENEKHIYLTNNPDNATPIDFICKKEAGELFTTSTIKYLGKNLRKKYGIDFHFHMLRHTHASMLIANGANMKDVQMRLGHASYQITMDTYSHSTIHMKNETVDIFERIVGAL